MDYKELIRDIEGTLNQGEGELFETEEGSLLRYTFHNNGPTEEAIIPKGKKESIRRILAGTATPEERFNVLDAKFGIINLNQNETATYNVACFYQTPELNSGEENK